MAGCGLVLRNDALAVAAAVLVDMGYGFIDGAVGATSRNDGCVHVGIDLTPKLVKHDYLIKGNAMYDE